MFLKHGRSFLAVFWLFGGRWTCTLCLSIMILGKGEPRKELLLCLMSWYTSRQWAAGQSSDRPESAVSLGWKGCVLMPSQDRNFVPRQSKNLWGGLLPKLASDSVFLASLNHGILSFGSWWQAACHLCFWCHVQGNALCHRAWKDTVRAGELPAAEAEVPHQAEWKRSGHHRTAVSLSMLPFHYPDVEDWMVRAFGWLPSGDILKSCCRSPIGTVMLV